MSRVFLDKVAPAFQTGQQLQEAAAASLMSATIQELLGEEGPHGEHLELLVQVTWLLNHLASAIAAQRMLTRRQAGLHGQPDDEPMPHDVLAAEMAEPLAGVSFSTKSAVASLSLGRRSLRARSSMVGWAPACAKMSMFDMLIAARARARRRFL